MAGKRHTPTEIIETLQNAEDQIKNGATVAELCQTLQISEQTYYRWRSTYSGVTPEQLARDAERLRELETENKHLRHAVVDLVLQMQAQKRGNGTATEHGRS